jgi:wyosine [tRNA(Phe)-imidazoG37] synthetase (radical SAM superfamily)
MHSPLETEGIRVMSLQPLFTEHERRFEQNRYVYPVLSRRSCGISVGVNLNPDKVCNFDCIYCQVDRRSAAETKFVALPQLLEELEHTLGIIASGEIYETTKFRNTPPEFRRLNDIAFSGDGEPTTFRNFTEIIAECARVKQTHAMHEVKMVLITNASMFHRTRVQHALSLLDANQGEIWAKLDAGTADYFQRVDRTTIPFERILDNILQAARVRPLVIQSLFMRINDQPPDEVEIEAYINRLLEIVAAGGKLQLIQIYTIARQPTENYVSPLTHAEVDSIVSRVQQRTQLLTQAYYGAAD